MSATETIDRHAPTDDAPPGWLPAKVLGCFECGIYVDASADANYCTRCGEELWELTKS